MACAASSGSRPAPGDRGVVLPRRLHQLPGLAHGLRQRALGLGEIHLRVGRVELDQHLAGLDQLGVVGQHRDHGARRLRGDRHQVAADIGVVSGLAAREDEEPQQQPDQGGGGEDTADDQQGALALAVAVAVAGFGVGGRRVRRSGVVAHGIDPEFSVGYQLFFSDLAGAV
jgi:hypothetical protein